MEGPDPQALVRLYETAVVALKKWQKEREEYLSLQRAADIAIKLTAEAAIKCNDAWDAYDKAAQTLEAAHNWRAPATSTDATDSEGVLKLLRS